MGVLIAATAPYIEATLTPRFTYAQVMGTFAGIVFVLGMFVIRFEPEAHRLAFGREAS